MKKLTELVLPEEIVNSNGKNDLLVKRVVIDSRQVLPGDLFVAIKGANFDGADFIPEAIRRGAVAIVTIEPVKVECPVCWIQVKNERRMLSLIASRFFDHPAEKLYLVGITGTNGKSTTANLIYSIFSAKERSAMIGTVGKEFCGHFEKNNLTTPESLEIFAFMDKALQNGCCSLVMEVSSAALKMQRVDDIHFHQAIFTGLAPEHLDFHPDIEDYFQSKLLLFRRLSSNDWAILNFDNEFSPRIMAEIDASFLTFGFTPTADIHPLKWNFHLQKSHLILQTPRGKLEINTPLIGRVNALNVMAAVAAAIVRGLDSDTIVKALEKARNVKGRLDIIYQNDFFILIDYAHTDRALEELLKSLNELKKNRLIVVFGAGGNRDRFKRPRMGEVATRLADYAIITSDNPRQEDPQAIIAEICSGIPEERKNFEIEIDREKAIARSIALAQREDIVVIAGKGHEDYQIFHDRTIHFSDQEVALKYIKGKPNG